MILPVLKLHETWSELDFRETAYGDDCSSYATLGCLNQDELQELILLEELLF